jgi:hypothetical protein
MGGKSLGQEFNEFSACMRKKMSGKLSGMSPNEDISEQGIGQISAQQRPSPAPRPTK